MCDENASQIDLTNSSREYSWEWPLANENCSVAEAEGANDSMENHH